MGFPRQCMFKAQESCIITKKIVLLQEVWLLRTWEYLLLLITNILYLSVINPEIDKDHDWIAQKSKWESAEMRYIQFYLHSPNKEIRGKVWISSIVFVSEHYYAFQDFYFLFFLVVPKTYRSCLTLFGAKKKSLFKGKIILT